MIIEVIDGIELRAAARDAEPTMLDLDLAKMAGMNRPRDIRSIIKRAKSSGFLQ